MLSIAIIFLVFTAINIGFYISFSTFSNSKKQETSSLEEIPVSVIICAKNESENLRQFVPLILSQDYQNFEVILINDASNDNSLEIMENFRLQDPRVQVVNVENNETFWANKKYALTLGIKRAKNKYLLFTDADCMPETDQWIKEMAANFSKHKSIVVGYGGYFKEKGILNKLIRFETLLTAIQYFTYTKLGSPYMGVGRNLAYTSDEFYANNGFANHLYIRSGDDDLFVNQAATKENTAVCYSEKSFTRSVPKRSFKKWFSQKRRHTSIAIHYKTKHKLLLGLFYFSQLFFWLFFFASLFVFWEIAVGALLVRLILQYFVFSGAAGKFSEKDLVLLFPLLELLLVCAQFAIFISNLSSKPKHWK